MRDIEHHEHAMVGDAVVKDRGRIRVGVLGAGGLGTAAARIIGMKRELLLTAICDSKGVVVSPDGVDADRLAQHTAGDLVTAYRKAMEGGAAEGGPGGGVTSEGKLTFPLPTLASLAASPSAVSSGCGMDRTPRTTPDRPAERGGIPSRVITSVEAEHCDDPLGAMIARAEAFDAVLVTLPNLPNEFIPGVIERFLKARHSLVFVDVLKRTRAVEHMLALDELVKQSQGVVMTGCGATPGMLAAAAVLAAQSFIEVERVDIWWGVGVANWEAYQATIREDIAHLPGYTVERAKAMTGADVDALLERTNGLLELRHMEHADDLLLQRVGVVEDRAQVEVGGVMDTRHPTKPVSTTMTLTGITADGKRASHRFILGDETAMADNVIGPALGYLKRGLWLQTHAIFGVFGSTEFLPMVVH